MSESVLIPIDAIVKEHTAINPFTGALETVTYFVTPGLLKRGQIPPEETPVVSGIEIFTRQPSEPPDGQP